MSRIRYLAILLSLLLLTGCQQSVQPVSLRGDLDSSPVDTSNHGDADVPAGPRRWRVAFLVDVSNSMAVMDPGGNRQRAAAEVVSRLSDQDAAYSFLLMKPCLEVNAGLAGGFVRNSEIIEQCLPRLSQAASTSDLQSGIEAARQMIQDDIYASSAEQLARTTYDLILVVDSAPSLVCDEGCGAIPCDGGTCVPCDAGTGSCPTDAGSSPQAEICDLPRSRWEEVGGPTSCSGDGQPYPHLKQCEPYNVLETLEPLVVKMVSLQDQGVRRIRLSVFVLKDDSSVNLQGAKQLFLPIAEAVSGVYWEVEASALSFIDLDGADLLGLQPEGT